MDLSLVKNAINEWFALAPIADDRSSPIGLVWGRLPIDPPDGPFALAYINAIRKLGHDVPQYVYNEVTDQNIETMTGVRYFTLRMSFRSFDQEAGFSARQYAESFRGFIEETRSTEYLSSQNLAYAGSSELIDVDYEFAGRLISQTELAISMGCPFITLSAGSDAGYIRRVIIGARPYIIDERGEPIRTETGAQVVSETTVEFDIDANEAP